MTVRKLAVLALVALASGVAVATDIRFVPVLERVAIADLVALGTVTEIEPEGVEADHPRSGKKAMLKIARVRLKEQYVGPRSKSVRVAFVAKENQPVDGRRIPTAVLEKGQEVLMFLRHKQGENFYRIPGYFGVTGDGVNKYLRGNLAEEVPEAKAMCKIIANPQGALKSKDDTERMMAAYMLATRYRTHPIDAPLGKTKETEIGAEESRAIMDGLLLLAEKRAGNFYSTAYNLNLTQVDGFGPAFTPEKAKAFIAENRDKYRIKMLVPAKE
jgi:hypothetical protein